MYNINQRIDSLVDSFRELKDKIQSNPKSFYYLCGYDGVNKSDRIISSLKSICKTRHIPYSDSEIAWKDYGLTGAIYIAKYPDTERVFYRDIEKDFDIKLLADFVRCEFIQIIINELQEKKSRGDLNVQ